MSVPGGSDADTTRALFAPILYAHGGYVREVEAKKAVAALAALVGRAEKLEKALRHIADTNYLRRLWDGPHGDAR